MEKFKGIEDCGGEKGRGSMKYCIFVERIYDDEKFRLLKEFIKNKLACSDGSYPPILDTEKIYLFVVTPANYYLAVAEQGYKGTMKQFEEIILQRYKELEQMESMDGIRVHLHLHLAMVPEGINQELMFRKATDWMKHNDFKPEMITFGWYIFNQESLRLAEKYGLKFFNDRFRFSFHDYELPNIFKPMMIAQNLRGMLR